MRITNNMMTNTLMSNLTRNMNRMSRYQDQLATGKQVIRASDDPVATSSILKFKSDIAALNQYEKNTGDSLAWLEVTESSVSDVGEVLQRMRELAVQAANGTNTVDDTKKIGAEIDQLKKHLVTDGNASFAGRYCFTGYQTDTPLFNEDGTYRIDITQTDMDNKAKLQYQVSIAQEMDVTTNGLDIFGYVAQTYAPEQYLAAGSTGGAVVPAGSVAGTASTKAELRGAFNPQINYSVAPNLLDITVDGTLPAFVVPTVGLDGSGIDINSKSEVDAFKAKVVNALNSASDGTQNLSQVADVFFDASGDLVIKAKAFGAHTITEGSVAWTATSTAGVASTNPVLVDTTKTIPGAIPAAMQAELKSTPLYLTVNGDRQRIVIDPLATLNTPADYRAALQTAIDNTFTPGALTVGEAGGVISFTGNTSLDGVVPAIAVDHVRAKESQMMNDINDFLDGLNGVAGAPPVVDFLGKIDAHLNQLLAVRADIGARVNRMELIGNRISDNTISFTTMLSDVQDADMAGVIMYLKNAENVYKAALSTGSKVIQPSLIDFLR